MNVNRKNDSMKKILVWGLLAVLGEEITLSANGEDEEDAMKSIENYLSNQ